MAKKNSGNSGRKSKYPEVQKKIPQIRIWRSQEGLTEKEVAKKLGIAPSTLEKYKTEYPEFAEALKEARQEIVANTFAALYKRARGYTYEEKKVYTRQEEAADGSAKEVEYTEITEKHEPPNVAACSLILKNLDREHDWSDNPTMLEVKRNEQKLRERLAAANEW